MEKLLHYTFVTHTTHLLDRHTLVCALRSCAISEIGDDFLDGCLKFCVDGDVAWQGTFSIDPGTIGILFTESISLDKCFDLSLTRMSYHLQLVDGHYLIIMVARCSVQCFHRTDELHDIPRDDIGLKIEIVAPELSIDKDMIWVILESLLEHQGISAHCRFKTVIRTESRKIEFSRIWHHNAYPVRRSGVLEVRLRLGFEGAAGKDEKCG